MQEASGSLRVLTWPKKPEILLQPNVAEIIFCKFPIRQSCKIALIETQETRDFAFYALLPSLKFLA